MLNIVLCTAAGTINKGDRLLPLVELLISVSITKKEGNSCLQSVKGQGVASHPHLAKCYVLILVTGEGLWEHSVLL